MRNVEAYIAAWIADEERRRANAVSGPIPRSRANPPPERATGMPGIERRRTMPAQEPSP